MIRHGHEGSVIAVMRKCDDVGGSSGERMQESSSAFVRKTVLVSRSVVVSALNGRAEPVG